MPHQSSDLESEIERNMLFASEVLAFDSKGSLSSLLIGGSSYSDVRALSWRSGSWPQIQARIRYHCA